MPRLQNQSLVKLEEVPYSMDLNWSLPMGRPLFSLWSGLRAVVCEGSVHRIITWKTTGEILLAGWKWSCRCSVTTCEQTQPIHSPVVAVANNTQKCHCWTILALYALVVNFLGLEYSLFRYCFFSENPEFLLGGSFGFIVELWLCRLCKKPLSLWSINHLKHQLKSRLYQWWEEYSVIATVM